MILSYLRTILMYLLLVVVIRVMGKRQIGEMEPAEFVVTMLAANLATSPIEDPGAPLLLGVIPIAAVLGAELTLSFVTMRSVTVRRLLCGKPVILIENGKLIQENLRRTRVTLDELIGQLRQKNVLDITTVQYAILETDGGMSVFPYPKERPASAKAAGIHPKPEFLPVMLVEDGRLLEENFRKAGKNLHWVREILRENHATLEQTLLLTVDAAGKVSYLKKEDRS